MYNNYTIELNQPVILNCSVSAVPRPEFQWILADTEEPLPESSWNSTTYVDKTTTSTLNYTFEMSDLNEYCRVHVVCVATNHYGRSEQNFTLFLNNSENCFIVPSTSHVQTSSIRAYINSTSSSIDYDLPIDSINSNISVFLVVGSVLLTMLVLLVLAITVCYYKYRKK